MDIMVRPVFQRLRHDNGPPAGAEHLTPGDLDRLIAGYVAG
jgi:hypothetical protein